MNRLLASSFITVALAGFNIGRAQTDTRTDAHAPASADGTMQKCCYLGVSTSIAPDMLREQLNLPAGVGIMIDDIDPASPANQAGLLAHDVIEKMNDQWVINVQQFSVLVRMQKPGDTIRLTVIRHGQPTEIKVALAEKALPGLEEGPGWLKLSQTPIPRPGTGRITGMLTYSDAVNIINIIAREDDRQVIIRDHNGRTLFDGPLNTPADRAKLPADLRDKVDRIERNSEEHVRELRAQGAAHSSDAPAAPGE